MANEKQTKSNLPAALIGIVFIIAAVVGLFWYNSAKTPAGNKPTSNTAKSKTPAITANAAPGAVPPQALGSPTASVTVEEFVDFQCPTCATVHPYMAEIRNMYGSKVRFILRNNPLAMHDKAYDASVAAEAAGLQGKFWEMQNLLFTNQQSWASNPGFKQTWNDYAQKLGLDVDKFQNDIAGLGAKQRVDEDLKRARSMGVNSTPTIFVNGVEVQNTDLNVPGLKSVIDGELAKLAQTAPAANGANANK